MKKKDESRPTEIDRTRIIDLVLAGDASTRLTNAIQHAHHNGSLKLKNVQDWKEIGSESARRIIAQIPNIGRKSVDELAKLVDAFISGDQRLIKACASKLDAAESTGRSETRDAVSASGSESPQEKNIAFQASMVLFLVNKRERSVLKSRYEKRMTLSETGEEFGLTRERIRQIQKAAQKKIAREASKYDLEYFVAKTKKMYWDLASNYRPYMLKSSLSHAFLKLPPEVRIFIDSVYGSFSEYLNALWASTDWGWITDEYDHQHIKIIHDRFLFASYELIGMPLVDVVAEKLNCEPGCLEIAIAVDKDWKSYRGVLLRSPLTRRKKRAIDCWRVISRQFNGGPVEIIDLVESYRSFFPKDKCTPRDLQIVMREQPTVFLPVGTYGWLEVATASIAAKLNKSFQSSHEIPIILGEKSDDSSLRKVIGEILEETGPIPYIVIQNNMRARLGQKYSKGSIAATLATNPEFVFFAPGVIGLYHQTDSEHILEKVYDYLLRESQVRPYIYALEAGLPKVSYPAWTVAMEYRWARWLQRESMVNNLATLLKYASISRWPASEKFKSKWTKIKNKLACGPLYIDFPKVTSRRILSVQVVKLAALFSRLGNGNWTAANRAAGQRIDSAQSGLYFIGILSILGVLQPAQNWWASHGLGQDCHNSIIAILQVWEKRNAGDGSDIWQLCYQKVRGFPPEGWLTPRVLSEFEHDISSRIGHIDDAREKSFNGGFHEIEDEEIIDEILIDESLDD